MVLPNTKVKNCEIFVGNVQTSKGIPAKVQHLKTIRLGDQAYCVHGTKIDPDYMLPLIVGTSDYDEYNRIMGGSIYG